MTCKKLLIVDDDPTIRYNFCRFLQHHGYDVRYAADGLEAMQMLELDAADMVITDYIMPRMGGIDLIEFINLKWPTLPVMLLTGYLSATAGNAMFAGMAEVLSKPATFGDLLAAIRRLLP